jgi:phage shock protein PspC (stress-responsive transcriptional regulator)
MKKVIHINLGGRPFVIDIDAYEDLDMYLKSIESHFKRSEGFEDIMYDIENRIAELLEAESAKNTVITLEKVEMVKNTMGRPEEFGAEAGDSNEFTRKRPSGRKFKTGKRLFRDPQDKVVAGVASGMSAYFGISDPIIIRLLFVIFTLSGGLGFLSYIVLWIAVPEAKTTSDFLAMRGEEINIDNIARSVENGLKDLKDKLDDLSRGIKTKMF